jgi:glucokinase
MKPYALGIDVGGTKIAAGIVNQAGEIITRYTTHAHSEKEPQHVIEAIGQAYHTLIAQSDIAPSEIEAVGLGFGGNTNGPAGLVLVSSNLPAWRNVPLRDIVAEQIGQTVILDNDTNLCALGEYHFGAGRGTQNMVYVTFSTGYGIGIIIDGRLYVGHTGTAGELGHVVIEIGGPPCSCGKNGCIMAYASGVGISRMVYERIEAGIKTSLRPSIFGRRISGEEVVEAAQQGDQVAREILNTAGYYAGVGLSMVVQILNPELIVLGGGLTRIGPLVMDQVEVGLADHTQPQLLDSVRLVPWTLGDDLGIIGAAAKVFAEAPSSSPGYGRSPTAPHRARSETGHS